MNGGPSEFPMETPLSRALHCILEVVQLFVLSVFGAVITSQMTTASIRALPPRLSDLRGLRIGIQTDLLQPFLVSVNVAAIPVIYNTLEDAVKLIYTTNPDNLDGFLTNTEIVQYFNQKYCNSYFIQTEPFLSLTEALDQKSFVMSKALPREVGSQFNAAMETHRIAGDVAHLFRDYIAAVEDSTFSQPLPLDSATRTGVISSIVLVSRSNTAMIRCMVGRSTALLS